jgi:hypothetical protein
MTWVYEGTALPSGVLAQPAAVVLNHRRIA